MQKWIKLLRLWQNAVEDKDRVPTLLVVGLGNPGKEYQDTRHNLGFKVVQEIAKREKISWKKEKLLEAEVAFLVKEGKEVALLMPQTYMNVSGRAVNAFLHRYKSCESFIVVVDDVTLDLGKVDISRVNPKRHNGLISIGECVKAREYPRLRLGIGPCPQGEVLADFVLSSPEGEEESRENANAIEKAVKAIELWLVEGEEKAKHWLKMSNIGR